MPIIKPGFTKGLRGRVQAATFDRRAHYLAAEHDREGVQVLTEEKRQVTPSEAIDTMGGKHVEYHEIVVSPSVLEREAIRKYANPFSSEKPEVVTAFRVSKEYAGDRPFVTAIHYMEDDRYHFHITVQGKEPGGIFGERGKFQKVWDAQWIVRPNDSRVIDWALYAESKQLQIEAMDLAKQQRKLRTIR